MQERGDALVVRGGGDEGVGWAVEDGGAEELGAAADGHGGEGDDGCFGGGEEGFEEGEGVAGVDGGWDCCWVWGGDVGGGGVGHCGRFEGGGHSVREYTGISK